MVRSAITNAFNCFLRLKGCLEGPQARVTCVNDSRCMYRHRALETLRAPAQKRADLRARITQLVEEELDEDTQKELSLAVRNVVGDFMHDVVCMWTPFCTDAVCNCPCLKLHCVVRVFLFLRCRSWKPVARSRHSFPRVTIPSRTPSPTSNDMHSPS